ncbi:hypothetical protein OF83DRAFT_1174983 [Amylostereum chailletii]|nr:hypothetical protein OF83DRAFT_1174983 [Amylostereum chailletii]
MATNPIDDSSSLHLVRPRKPVSVQRSHSLVSLPTPPSTVHKRPRSRASSAYASDNDDEDNHAVPEPSSSPLRGPHDELTRKHKRRRIDDVVAEIGYEDREREEAFWMDRKAAPVARKPKPTLKPRSRTGPSVSARLSSSSRRLSHSIPASKGSITSSAARAAAAATLLSPPPTRPRPPVTPPRPKRVKVGPKRDSPNNPFLQDSPPSSPVGPKTPLTEQQTITYVFRGKKQTFGNPYFYWKPDPRSDLPTRHPDFTPSDNCAPRRLFPQAGQSKPRQTPPPKSHQRSVTPDPWDSDADEGEKPSLKSLPRMTLATKFAKIAQAGPSHVHPHGGLEPAADVESEEDESEEEEEEEAPRPSLMAMLAQAKQEKARRPVKALPVRARSAEKGKLATVQEETEYPTVDRDADPFLL